MNNKYTQSAFVADSISLGPHWIYNQSKIARQYPEGVTTFSAPASQYHPGKEAGDFTHYGDQTEWLAEVCNDGGFDLERWRAVWLDKMAAYSGYVDGASKETLASGGSQASSSNDLAGASRIAPLLDLGLSLEDCIKAAREQTGLTHGDAYVIDAAEFFVRAVYAYDSDIKAALEHAAITGEYTVLDATAEINKALSADSEDYIKVSNELGLTCHFPEAFPLALYFALHHGENFTDCISLNALAGGDTSARAMLLVLFFSERSASEIDGLERERKRLKQIDEGNGEEVQAIEVKAGSNSVMISENGLTLHGVLEMPESSPVAYAVFAHCFTCGKDFLPEAKIAKQLAKRGIAVLRIDFSGVGASDVEFKDTSFITNIADLETASRWLSNQFSAPSLLIGHSLGGTAVLAATAKIPSIKAVVTIGSPADPGHVTHFFEDVREDIMREGSATVKLAGRPFTVGKKFLDDLESYDQLAVLSSLKVHSLIMHSPQDATVSVENAGKIYSALKHPKSFISLPNADHLLIDEGDIQYVATMISAWSTKALS